MVHRQTGLGRSPQLGHYLGLFPREVHQQVVRVAGLSYQVFGIGRERQADEAIRLHIRHQESL